MPGTSGSASAPLVRLSVLHEESFQLYESGIVGRTDALIRIRQLEREWGLTKALNEAHAYRTEDGELVVFLVTEEVDSA